MADLEPLRVRIAQHGLNLVDRAAVIARDDTRAAASRRTGALADGIDISPAQGSPLVISTITSAAPYSQYQDEGTGVYGPTGTRIFPRSAKALVFDWPAAGGVVAFRSIAGAPGRHYFHEPMRARWHDALTGQLGQGFTS